MEFNPRNNISPINKGSAPGILLGDGERLFLPTLEDIRNMDIKVEWLVEKTIPENSNTILDGRTGIKKTWLLLQIGSCVADGKPFLGHKVKQMPVYYIDFENPLPVLHDRAEILGGSNLRVWHLSNDIPPPRLDRGTWEYYKSLPLGLFIIDSLRASQEKNEDSSQEMTFIMNRLKELRSMGFTILSAHHTPKYDDRISRGSMAIVDQADHVLSLDRVKGIDNDQRVDGDDESPDDIFRLGVRIKSRYKQHEIYLRFNPNKGFEMAPDPDEEKLMAIHSLMLNFKTKEGRAPIRGDVISLTKNLGIDRKRCEKLLKRGEDRLWISTRGPHNSLCFEPVCLVCPPIKGGTNEQTDPGSQPSLSDTPQGAGLKLIDTIEFACLQTPPEQTGQTTQLAEVSLPHPNQKIVESEQTDSSNTGDDPKQNAFSLVEESNQRIEKVWKPGVVSWLKTNRSEEWRKMKKLEEEINNLALRGNMDGLTEKLAEREELVTLLVNDFRYSTGSSHV